MRQRLVQSSQLNAHRRTRLQFHQCGGSRFVRRRSSTAPQSRPDVHLGVFTVVPSPALPGISLAHNDAYRELVAISQPRVGSRSRGDPAQREEPTPTGVSYRWPEDKRCPERRPQVTGQPIVGERAGLWLVQFDRPPEGDHKLEGGRCERDQTPRIRCDTDGYRSQGPSQEKQRESGYRGWLQPHRDLPR